MKPEIPARNKEEQNQQRHKTATPWTTDTSECGFLEDDGIGVE
jgi:hypothetical protein